MAGDWIMLDPWLKDAPEVMRISDATGLGEAAVIGHLYLLWSWADQHTKDGSNILDRSGLAIVSRSPPEFIDAAVAVGFVQITDRGSIVVGRGMRVPPLRGSRKGTVYFILAQKSNLIKIGFTSGNIDRRLEALQTGAAEALQLVACVAGTMDTEREYHARFSHLRSIGEWFRYDNDLRQLVEGLS